MSLYTIVLLTEKALTEHDVDRVAHLHDPEPVRIHLVVPLDTIHRRWLEALDEAVLGRFREAVDPDRPTDAQARLVAEHALESGSKALAERGVEVSGELGPDNPVDAVAEAAARLDADEVIVITEPHLLEEGLRRDWASQIRERANRPVLHFVAGTDRVVS